MTVALAPRDPAALSQYASAVSDPGSPSYHRYLSVSQFAGRFGPTREQISAVEGELRARGLAPGPVSANGLAIPVTARAGVIERAFATPLERVRLRDGQSAFLNTAAPSFAADVAPDVEAVVGLDDLAQEVPEGLRRSDPTMRTSTVTPHSSTGGPTPCAEASAAAASEPTTYTADQIASAYDLSSLYGAGDEGAGETIGIYELEPNIPSDITDYQQCYGTDTSVSYVEVDGGPGPPDIADQTGLETELDVESVIGLAPQARILVYQGPNSNSGARGAGPYDTYNAIISQDQANVITTSWGICEAGEGQADAAAEYDLFEEAAIQGQTVVAAAGDDGSEDCYAEDGSTSLAVDDPGSQPFVTSVGGTSLTLSPSRSETVWNDRSGAGGGGISSVWPMPPYQSQAPSSLAVINSYSSGAPCGAASGYCREVPDVSADADPETGVLIVYDGQWGGIGGTSAAAPMWAALLTLTDASPACAGSPVGFANPALYRAASTAYSSDFYDITSGNNDFTDPAAALYPAGPGYDLASGLGSPNGAALAATLCALTVHVSNPGTQTSVVGVATRTQVQATDAAGQALTYAAKNLPPGLAIDPSSGLISGVPAAAGSYEVTVSAVDGQASAGEVTFTWTVAPVSVSLANPGRPIGEVGVALRLVLAATDDNQGKLAYRATGLPAGLSLNSVSGLISGKPTRGERSTVTIAVIDGTASATETFVWTIEGRPTASLTALAGLASGKPSFALTVKPGIDGSDFKRIRITLPAGFGFAARSIKLAKGIVVENASGRRLNFTTQLTGGKLLVVLASPAASLKVEISALTVSRAVIGDAADGRLRAVGLTIAPTDETGWTPELTVKLKL